MQTQLFSRTAVMAALSLCGLAHAASSATVQIDSFNWSVANGGTLAWTGVDGYQVVSAQAEDGAGLTGYDQHQSTGAIAADSQSAATLHAGGTATATANRTGSAMATTGNGPGVSATSQANMGTASVNQSDAFTLTGADTVTFTVDYTINVSSPNGNQSFNYAEGALDFSAGSYLGTSGGSLDVEKYSFDSLTGIGTYTGELSLTVTMNGADDVGYYSLVSNAFASSPSAIPEPSEAMLLLAGLGTLGMCLRRCAGH